MIRRRMHSTLAWKQYCRFTVIAPWLGSHQCSDPPRWERRNAASFPARLLSYLLPFLLPHSISKRFPTFRGIIFNDKTLPPSLSTKTMRSVTIIASRNTIAFKSGRVNCPYILLSFPPNNIILFRYFKFFLFSLSLFYQSVYQIVPNFVHRTRINLSDLNCSRELVELGTSYLARTLVKKKGFNLEVVKNKSQLVQTRSSL